MILPLLIFTYTSAVQVILLFYPFKLNPTPFPDNFPLPHSPPRWVGSIAITQISINFFLSCRIGT